MATLCTCVRESPVGPVVLPDPECPAYLLHLLYDRVRS